MERSGSRQAWRAAWRQALSALTLGWDLAIPIFGGVLAGHYLDRRLATRYAFTIGLLVLGLVVAVYNVARTLQRELRRDQLDLVELADGRTWDRMQEPRVENVHYLSKRS
jgi:predicted F0F1-ATPase subunit